MDQKTKDPEAPVETSILKSNLDESSFDALFKQALDDHSEAIKTIREFWNLFLDTRQDTLNLSKFNYSARAVNDQIEKTAEAYDSLLNTFPDHPQLQSSFAKFQKLILRDISYQATSTDPSGEDNAPAKKMRIAGTDMFVVIKDVAPPPEVLLRSKLQKIQESEKSNASILRLSGVLTGFFGLMVIMALVGIIVNNVQPSPTPSYQFLNALVKTDAALSQVFTASVLYFLANNNDKVYTYCVWNTSLVTSQKPLCPWIKSG